MDKLGTSSHYLIGKRLIMSQSFSKRNAEKHIYSACSLFSFVRNLLDLVRIDLHVEVDLGRSLTFIEDVNIWTIWSSNV